MTSRHLIAVLLAMLAGAPAPAFADDTAAAPVAIDIQAANGPQGVHYLIQLRNRTEAAQPLVVSQSFVRSPSNLAPSGEGAVESGKVAWSLEIPPNDWNRVSSEATFRRGDSTLTTVCLADATTGRTLDCTTGDLGAAGRAAHLRGPLWTVAIGLVLLGAAITGLVYAVLRWRSRLWAALLGWASPRRNTLAVWGAGLAILALVGVAFLFIVGRVQPFLDAQAGSSKNNIGWAGQPGTMEVGVPAASRQAEFTLYQWSCGAAPDAPVQCVATVAVRNLTESQVPWLGRMQRLQEGTDNWVEPDLEATAAANGGTDPFAAPLTKGERRFASVVFKPTDPTALTRLELREGSFAAGVSLNLK